MSSSDEVVELSGTVLLESSVPFTTGVVSLEVVILDYLLFFKGVVVLTTGTSTK